MTETPSAALRIDAGNEPFRPRAHFTPHRNWINDPNGLVWFDGEYHLFYQYNPKGMDWGNMCWGHAVSPDLAHWQELPVAIPETDQMIFSGSIVVDRDNVSGLGAGDVPPLVAIFTAYDAATSIQSQHLAFSHDRGRTFTHYAANPIIDLGLADFRDPKVFYHDESAAWVMVVALARDHVVQFYRSQNLVDWAPAGSFGPAGSTSGQWECPDMFPVPIDDEPGRSAWVLKIDVDVGLTDGGSGAQYFVGDFDGHRFTVDPVRGSADGDLVDQGPDFYAAITWSELPDAQCGPVWIGWQSNHQTGRYYPTNPWRGAMSFPRRLFLYDQDGRLRLGQSPIMAPGEALVSATGNPVVLGAVPVMLAAGATAFQHHLVVCGNAGAKAVLSLADGEDALLEVVLDPAAGHVVFTRHASRHAPFEGFRHVTSANSSAKDRFHVHIVVDGSLVEIFMDGGCIVYSGSVFPAGAPVLSATSPAGQACLIDHGGATLRRTVMTNG